MSCWVVPTVAADYWGVTLDVVWHRICNGVVPHKTEQGFVFIDLDPWTADVHGNTSHEPPSTFVPAGEEVSLEESVLSQALPAPDEIDPAEWTNPRPCDEEIEFGEAELLSSDSWRIAPGQDAMNEQEPELVFANPADDQTDLEAVDEDSGDDELPELDEEETATFGRLSWQEVRSQVSRTRRPPPSRSC